jgi:hypothetical protein
VVDVEVDVALDVAAPPAPVGVSLPPQLIPVAVTSARSDVESRREFMGSSPSSAIVRTRGSAGARSTIIELKLPNKPQRASSEPAPS